jgi:predicted RNA-binding Zn-ribbon protein involved in translation (DUF1610 family)
MSIAAMSEVRAFFRHCPACGRRFEIRVVRKEARKDDSYASEMPRLDTDTTKAKALAPLLLNEADEQVVVEEKELGYTYICKHCGHKWTELHEDIDVEPSPEGYTGD